MAEQVSTLYPGDTLQGAYQACAPPSAEQVVTFAPKPIYVLHFVYIVANQTACEDAVGSWCGYGTDVTWDAAPNSGGGSLSDLPFRDHGNGSCVAVFAGSNDLLTYKLTMDSPTNLATLIFEVTDTSGNVVSEASTASTGSTTISGSWAPPA